MIYYQREDWIESDPLIVTGLSHWGKASVPTSKILYSNTKSKMTCYLAALAKNLLHTAHLVATGPARETDAANKTSFFSKTKPPFTLDKQSRTEQIKSDKVEEALEASVEEC